MNSRYHPKNYIKENNRVYWVGNGSRVELFHMDLVVPSEFNIVNGHRLIGLDQGKSKENLFPVFTIHRTFKNKKNSGNNWVRYDIWVENERIDSNSLRKFNNLTTGELTYGSDVYDVSVLCSRKHFQGKPRVQPATLESLFA